MGEQLVRGRRARRVRIRWEALLLLPVAWLAAACGDDGEMGTGPAPADSIFHQADLEALERWLRLERSWPPGALAEAEARLQALRALDASLPETRFYLAVAEIVGLADNGHSNISRLAVYNRWGILPIRAFWFTDGLFIVRASPAHADLVGGEIVAIAGRTPEALAERMGVYHGGSDEFLRAYWIHSLLLSPALLDAAGVTDRPERVPITVRLRGGGEETVDMPEFPATAPFALPWRYLSPEPISGENGWRTVLSGIGDVPWALQEPGRPFRYRYLADRGVAHVQLRANRDLGGASIAAFLAEVRERVATDRPRHVILDNRENDGGNLGNTADWALALHEALPPEGMVFSLTSNATFSAGIYTALFPEAAEPDRTLVVGTLVGDRPRFFAEGGSDFRLPVSGHGIRYSDLAHDLTARCASPLCLFANDPRLDIVVRTLEPDVSGGFTFEEFAAGRDPDVERVLALLGS